MGSMENDVKDNLTSEVLPCNSTSNLPRLPPTPPSSWPPLKRSERFLLFVMLAVVTLMAVPRLNPGICYGDSGEVQVASAEFGIWHPPGYAGYSTLGYIITRIPFVDPAYLITLACLGAGLVMLWFCYAFQLRLGVHPLIAAITCLAFTAHRRTWTNLLIPEVYVLSLMFLMASAYMMVKYHRVGQRRDFFLSALLYGFVLANRPPVLFVLPFFIIVWWISRKRWEPELRKYAKTFLLGVVLIALPLVYSVTFFWVRDQPETTINYIDQFNESVWELPKSQDGFTAKAERIYWLMAAKQFSYKFGNTYNGVRSKLRWLKNDLLYARPGALAVIVILTIIGLILAFMKDAAITWLVLGVGLYSIVFVCLYRIYEKAADLLPLLFAMTVFCGVMYTKLLSLSQKRYQTILMIALTVAFGMRILRDTPTRHDAIKDENAIPFLQEVDLDTFPRDAIIGAGWRHATPLWYAQYYIHSRPDLHIVAGEPPLWIELARQHPDKPVYVIHSSSELKQHTLIPFRNMWRLKINPDIKN